MTDKKSGQQKLPDNWTADGMSKGKPSGPVRPTSDAHNSKKGKG